MDVSNIFFYNEVDEDIYIIQPVGLEDGTGQMCKLEKALYGLEQALQVWTKKVQKLSEEIWLYSI